MQRTIRLTNTNTRAILLDTSTSKKQNEQILEILANEQHHNGKVRSYLEAKIPDIDEFFPVRDNKTLERFLDESDGLYPLRRSELMNRLYLCSAERKNIFATSVLNSLFSDNYINTHAWPTHK